VRVSIINSFTMRFLTLLALVAGASAATPPGFLPENDDSLTVVFGTTEATNGKNIPQDDITGAPSVYTHSVLSGRYYILMVDPDAIGGYLHWVQPLMSETHTSSNGKGYLLNSTLLPSQPFKQPSPPFRAPYTHRYVLLLLNATDITGIGEESFEGSTVDRTPFNVASVVKTAGVPIVGSTWFNVTNKQALASLSSSTSSASKTSTSSSSASSSASSTTSTTGTASTTSASTSASSAAPTTNVASGLRWDAVVAVGVGAVAFAGLL